MNGHDDVEAWADALLERHRSAPPPDTTPVPLHELDPATRATVKLGLAPPPDRDRWERIQRRTRVHEKFARGYAIVTIAGATLGLAFLVTLLSTF